jgi:dihydrolipoamide dehydrogenase
MIHPMAELTFDVVVIGAGTAGLAAAKAAHAEGARVAVVDHGPLGTFCARLGCMPSKALLESARALAHVRRAGALGVMVEGAPRLTWSAVRARESQLVADFVGKAVAATTTSKSFTLLRGSAEFLEDGALGVDGRRVVGKRWVLATGSSPVRPPTPGLDEVAALTLTSDDVFELESIPSSIAVIGSGAVGIELGQFLARAGVHVHVLGHDDRVAGLAPGPLQDALRSALGREVALQRSVRIERVRREGDCVVLVVENQEELRVERLLFAAGRRPNLDGLSLSRVGVDVKDGKPVHDEYLRTTNAAVFVAGDAAGAPQLLHAATIQGSTAGRNAARDGELERPGLDPALRVVFCDPIVASVGLDPDDARRAGHRACVVVRPWAEQGKARLMGETDGAAQLVVDRETRKVLGCQLVGPHADLLVHLVSYAIHFGATVDGLLALHHYHPTLAEMIPSLAQKAVATLDGECTRGDVAAVVDMQ